MNINENKLNTYKVGSLFAGIGGICKGFNKAGFTLEWANELDRYACQTYRENFKHKLIEGDINKLSKQDFSDIDVLTSGFPCQAFSIAGEQKGFDDARGHLFFETIRIVKELRPKVIFLENVKNLQSHNNGKTFKIIQETILDLRYSFTYLYGCL